MDIEGIERVGVLINGIIQKMNDYALDEYNAKRMNKSELANITKNTALLMRAYEMVKREEITVEAGMMVSDILLAFVEHKNKRSPRLFMPYEQNLQAVLQATGMDFSKDNPLEGD